MRFFALLSVMILTACGFQPMYGTASSGSAGQAVEAHLDQVDINIIPDAEGVYLRNRLIDRFYRDGYPVSPRYILAIPKIRENTSDFDVTRDSEATRRLMTMSSTMKLVERETGETLLSRPLKVSTSYDVIGSQFTTNVAEQDAREAALNDLARQVERQLVLYFQH